MDLFVVNTAKPKVWRLVTIILVSFTILAVATIALRVFYESHIWLEAAAAFAFVVITTLLVVNHLQLATFNKIQTSMSPINIEKWVRFGELSPIPPSEVVKLINAVIRKNKEAEAERARLLASKEQKSKFQSVTGGSNAERSVVI